MASQIFYNGEFYDCLVTSEAGQSPTTHPENWRRVEIPRDAGNFVVQRAYSLLLSGDGQEDKRRSAERAATTALQEAILAMARNRTQPNTLRVLTR